MWKNLKISAKLFLGFGLILCIFIVSILIVRRYVVIVENGSELLDRVSVVLDLTNRYNSEAYEVFMAMRSVQYTESREAISEYINRLNNVMEVENGIAAIYEAYPDLPASAHVVNVVQPIAGQYVELAERTILQISEKQAATEAFDTEGSDLSNTVSELIDMLHSQLESDIRSASIETGRSNILALRNAIYLVSGLLEKIMALRNDSWHGIAVAQADGGIGKLREIDGKAAELRVQAEQLKPYFDTQEQRQILERLLLDFDNYYAAFNVLITAYAELDQMHRERNPLMASLSAEVNNAASMAVDQVEELSRTNIDSIDSVLTVMSASTILCVILAVLIGLFIARSIAKPLNTIVGLAKRARDGDLTIKREDFGYEGRDEMGYMVAELSEMIEAQNVTLTHILKISKELVDGAGDLSAISEETNAAMEEIRASISQIGTLSESNEAALEQTNAGVSEMSSGADTVASSATDSASFIAVTTNTSNDAIQTMRNVIDGMRNVSKIAKESEEKMRRLILSVDNVSSFVSVITGIADQTNLLALNAAIEAARAGEVGRGFAVVAEEVRKLAEESARAAKNVNDNIKELQAGAQDSIHATTEAGGVLLKILDSADQALSELNGALNQINNANESIQNIAAVAEEQAASSKEIVQAIDHATKASTEMVESVSNIRRATDETTHGTEGVAIQAETMTTHARTLSDLLAMFKLESAESAGTRMLKSG